MDKEKPEFTPEENLLRIEMDQGTKYVLVEGEDDIPKYEALLTKHSSFSRSHPFPTGSRLLLSFCVPADASTRPAAFLPSWPPAQPAPAARISGTSRPTTAGR